LATVQAPENEQRNSFLQYNAFNLTSAQARWPFFGGSEAEIRLFIAKIIPRYANLFNGSV
jgi:hypothetical protein